ncbi:terminase family protein [bacterium]|nr:terminase family protein [bacterium]
MSIFLSQKQRDFVRCRHRYCAFIGGVRSGKSFAGTIRGIKFARRKGGVGAVIAPTYPMLRDVIIPLWQRLLPAKYVKKYSQSQHKLWLKNGSVVLFRSAEKPERLYGLTLHWFHIDEAATVERKVWDVMLSRVISTKGYGFLTTTPNGHNWVYELVKSGEIAAVFAKTTDNPLIDPAEVERAKKVLDPKFFRQQYEASFEAYIGQVYDDFAEGNILSFSQDGCARNFIAADFGWQHPTALLWAKVFPDGDIFFVDEVVEPHLTPDMIAKIVVGEKVKLPSGRIFAAPVVWADVEELITGFEATQTRQESGGFAIVDLLKNSGIDRIRVVGGAIVRGIFSVRSKILDAAGRRHLFVSPECRRLIADFRGYRYPEGAGNSSAELPLKDGIHDHTMDAVRYLVMALELENKVWRI